MKKYLFLILTILLFSKSSITSHAMGGKITYRCLGNDQYEVTFTFYRDCAGIPADLSMDINITSGSCGFNVAQANLLATAASPVQLGYTCPAVSTTCDTGVYIGIEKWVYQGIITLPAPCAEWKISHCENGGRNAAITTILGAAGVDICVFALINNVAGLCNNSPVFSNEAVPSGCVGNRLCLSQDAFDIDGDSLAYEMISPLKGPGTGDTVTYLNNLSHLQPILSSPPVTFEPLTGEICLWPSQTDVTILAILVNEYRNGVLIGQVERDIQLNILACNNHLPDLTGANGNPTLTTSVCAGEQSCFWIASVDADVSNVTHLNWDHSISNMTSTNTSGNRDTLYLCWAPAISDTAGNPYIFTATVSDNNCPYLGVENKTYTIYVVDTGICATVSVEPLSQQDLSIKIYPQPASDFLLIDFKNTSNNKYHLILINVLGETVFQSQLKDEKTSIDISSWKNGVYFSELIDENGRLISAEKTILVK